MTGGNTVVLADASLRLNAGPIDYVLIGVYFVLVLGIGAMARRSVSSSLDFFLSALSTVVNLLLGWPLWLSIVIAAAIVLAYTTLGGLSAAIYNEVMQFFVILALLIPLTIVGLAKVGGWNGLMDKIKATDIN